MQMVETPVFQIEHTATTPRIVFNRNTGRIEISGVSVPENGQEFYKPVLDLLAAYALKPAAQTELTLCLDYFNISSSKMILFILYKLMEIRDAGHEVSIIWLYCDEELHEAGTDYEHMTRLRFTFRKVPAIKIMQN